jgi:transcriptional regulator with XRE-family HTH domain
VQSLTRFVGGEPNEECDTSTLSARSDGRRAEAETQVGGLQPPIPATLQDRPGNRIVVKSPNQIDISLGARLRDKRISTGWSQEQLAEKLQIDAKDISAYETGAKRIAADRLLRLSKVLGVKPVYFFGFEDHERPAVRHAARLTLPDQGLRLHRAFISVKNPALREAIVSLVTELARNDDPS